MQDHSRESNHGEENKEEDGNIAFGQLHDERGKLFAENGKTRG